MISVDVVGAAVGNVHGADVGASFRWSQGTRSAAEGSGAGRGSGADSDLNGLVDFGLFGIIAKPLFLWLKWTYRARDSELGLGDRPADADHQPGAAAAAHHADEVDAEDAARGAADQGDSGKI